MSIALGTLLLFLLVIPGIAFRSAFYSGPLTRKNDPLSPIDKFISAFIPGIFIQLICFWAIQKISWCDYTVDLESLGNLLFGTNKANINFLENDLDNILLYNISVCILGAIFGLGSRKIIRYLRLDHHSKLWRFNNDWYYILRGEFVFLQDQMSDKTKLLLKQDKIKIRRYLYDQFREDFKSNWLEILSRIIERWKYIKKLQRPFDDCRINAVVKSDDNKCYIYFGTLGYFTTLKGDLDTIQLLKPSRRAFTDDCEKYVYEIPAQRVVLKYSEIITISVSLVKAIPMPPKNHTKLELEAWKQFTHTQSLPTIGPPSNGSRKAINVNIRVNGPNHTNVFRTGF